MKKPEKKTDAEYKKELSPDVYRVTRKKGTESPYDGVYYKHFEEGLYHCACCDLPLFSSEHKYDSGSGWPSFWASYTRDTVKTELDKGMGMIRTEIKCSACDAHLGHLFDDGPQPTGLRFCTNSLSLRFKKK